MGVADGGMDAGAGVGADAGPTGARVPTPELCNQPENDCDTSVDEDFDKLTDSLACGATCRVCPDVLNGRVDESLAESVLNS